MPQRSRSALVILASAVIGKLTGDECRLTGDECIAPGLNELIHRRSGCMRLHNTRTHLRNEYKV